MRKLIPGLLAIAAATGFSVWAYPHLPAQVATHFDLQGDPNGWSSRLLAVALAPAIGVFMALMFTFLPRIDPKRANYEKFGATWWTVANAALILLALVHVAMLGKALGWAVDISRIVGVGVGGMFILIGNLMTRIRPNWFMGIRTPWTLSSDTVWRKTHRFGGVAFVIAGVCIAVTGLLGSGWALYAAIGTAVVAGLGSVVYSYVVWKGEQAGQMGSGAAGK
ncbi:MAG TPA: SdpI family protein [Gemmatimonadales bacterium]|nr:SdpI family protein [Gemmatimonadales bacterium]